MKLNWTKHQRTHRLQVVVSIGFILGESKKEI